jgi:hypothetical protein
MAIFIENPAKKEVFAPRFRLKYFWEISGARDKIGPNPISHYLQGDDACELLDLKLNWLARLIWSIDSKFVCNFCYAISGINLLICAGGINE